ncbi:formylglycine-generating enzyme family protein [Saccharibacillus alkalitolerans]|uniref:Formylglycine-generating enzyme family protein n=1 Tax=Saccharibacillus alkalitolerans TaxID=2705290 RepID=A0ABX0FAJ1_9BACL|nr:SUMF1/EgtB/PvdO family nonheme iron enzyme [Saccharibacillus alkalitolerans]NGZ77059.1 formylglycine-generating enzyme family protein [Saccharibacillus alkalitolerans]
MKAWNRDEWSRLNRARKQEKLQGLSGSLPKGFVFKGIETFEAAGRQTETGLFEYEGCEFVFVPGDRAVLGWADWTDAAAEGEGGSSGSSPIEADFRGEEERLRHILSPERTADIGPMLVERRARYAGWDVVEPGQLDRGRYAELLEQLEAFRAEEGQPRYYERSYRFERKNEGIEVCLSNETDDFEEWAGSALQEGFDLPTEDEWEYMYGGGRRTLFPWGNSLSAGEEAPASHHSGWTNGFGLHFRADCVDKELVRTDEEWDGKGGEEWTGKGGHGNREWLEQSDDVWPRLSLSAFYRDPYEDEQEWGEWLDLLHARRIVRL